MRSGTIVLVVLALLASRAAWADDAKPSAAPPAPTMEAICGEWGNDLYKKRQQDELDLAQARAHVKALQKQLHEATGPTPGK